MKDRLRDLIDEGGHTQANLNVVREYLQHYVVYLIYRSKMYLDLAFMGGTALRMLYGVPRFSEDLDFSSITRAEASDMDILLSRLAPELSLAGYEVDQKQGGKGNVRGVFLKFKGLLHELGISPRSDQVFALKVEVDCNPPAQAGLELRLVNRYHMAFSVRHHDLPTLFAGKLSALCFRKYGKARDVYDLFWLLSAYPNLEPNLAYLNSAARQTESDAIEFAEHNWRSIVMDRIKAFDLAKARKEIQAFLLRSEEADFLTEETFATMLRG